MMKVGFAGRSTVMAFFAICIGIVTINWGTVSWKRHNAEKASNNQKTWSAEAYRLLDNLNDWDHTELQILNNPDKYPNTETSGQTNGWISAQIEELNKLDATVQWNAEDEKYVLANQEDAR